MNAIVRARYANGVLTPLEPLDLEEGTEVTVSVQDGATEASGEATAPKQGLAAIVEMALEMQKDIPPEELANLPTDLAKSKKHYLYGHPKEGD